MPCFPLIPCAVVLTALGSTPSPAGRIVRFLPTRADVQEAGSPAPATQQKETLAAEDRDTLELIRSAITEKDLAGARELLHEVVAGLEAPAAGAEAARVAFLLELDRLASELGSLEESLVLCGSVVELRTRLLPPDHADLLTAKHNLATARAVLGDIAGAHELFEEVHAACTRLLPPDDPVLLRAKDYLASARYELGDLAGARELEEAVLEARTRLLPPDDPVLLDLKLNLSATRYMLGDLAGARELGEAVLEARTRLLPPDDPDLLDAKGNVAATRKALGDLAGARELEEAVLEARTRLLPPDHPDLLTAKKNLAVTMAELGDLEGANEVFEEVVAARTRLLPPDHHDLLSAKLSLAVTKRELGDLKGANELFEEVHAARTRLLPPDHPDLLMAKQNLAATRAELGDLAGARELEEAVLEAQTRLLPPDHPALLRAKQNLAATRAELGDHNGAYELVEEVFVARTRLFPPDHPEVLRAMLNLAAAKRALGDLAGARELDEAVLEARTRLLPSDHPEVLRAKRNLAVTKNRLGDIEGANALFEEILAVRTRLLPPDHPDLLGAKQNLALTRKELGDLAGARELEEAVLEVRTRLLPPDHPDLLGAKLNLAATRYMLGDLAGARELVSSRLQGMLARARSLRAEGLRPAREGAQAELQRLSEALFLSASADPEHTLDRQLFATLESLRLASVASAEVAHATGAHPEFAEEARGIAEIRSRLNDLAAAGPADEDVEGWRAEILRLTEERDRRERGLRAKLAEAGSFNGEIDSGAIGTRLANGTAAAAFLRYTRPFEKDPRTGETPPSVESLLVFVVQPGGAVRRIELGPLAELEALVGDWRAALGRPLQGRGIRSTRAASAEKQLDDVGRRLRERVLDPVLAAVGPVHALHVELDDVLFLVPLDAMPLERGLVGERIAIRSEATLARLLRVDSTALAEGNLLLAGGIDYDAEPSAALVRLDATTPPLEAPFEGSAERSASGAGFVFLPGTTQESAAIAALYAEVSEREAILLTGNTATKAALFAAAPRTRFLHLATHGWFASERFESRLDTPRERGAHDSWLRAEATLTGFAPETLCGLALAGANRGKDSLGRVPGILTAEELASLDLRNCELAVLSACDTNVGIRRAGQGIQSLQSALHAAGARTAITSLWKIDDAATQRLFELFYTKLWKEKLGKADALWQAKMALRAEGHPLHDWAGWVLSGSPD